VKKKRSRGERAFSVADWRDIYDLLWDAANVHHSGPRADRAVALAQKVREEKLS
jgi:hypothetical protein